CPRFSRGRMIPALGLERCVSSIHALARNFRRVLASELTGSGLCTAKERTHETSGVGRSGISCRVFRMAAVTHPGGKEGAWAGAQPVASRPGAMERYRP